MKPFTFCATADLHLGMRFSSYPSIQGPLIQARFDALKNIVTAANEKECQLLVIAGDLFDRVNVPAAEVAAAAAILGRFEGECIAVLPGNHDYYGGSRSGVWDTLAAAGIDNLLLLNELRPYSLESYHLPVALYPGPCTAKHSAKNAVSWIEPLRTDAEKMHLGIAHGSISGISPDMNGEYYPMDQAQLRLSGLDIWIIGHAHVPYPAAAERDPDLIVPGTPEPDGFDYGYEGGAYIISVNDRKETEVERIHTGTYRFLRMEVEVQGLEDLKLKIDEILDSADSSVLLQVLFRGTMQKNDLSTIREELERLENGFFYAEIDTRSITAVITPEDIGNEFREESFPYQLLTKFAEEEDSEALELSYRIIREMQK